MGRSSDPQYVAELNEMGPNMQRMDGATVYMPDTVIDRAVHNSPPPLDDVGGLEDVMFDPFDPDNPFADCAPLPFYEGKAIIKERAKTHGDFSENARITQNLKKAMRLSPNWSELSDRQIEALEMIAHKMGRILAGNPDHDDHWADIAGYAELLRRSCGRP